MKSQKFVFRKHANIGAADAIEDRKFLERSFVDNGSLDVLLDTSNPQCIVLGRTGLGKTALIERIREVEERVIRINPEGLALTYISTNNVLRFFLEAGVNLDLFYRLLWRHVFAVEIIRQHYHIVGEQESNTFWSKIRQIFDRDNSKREAIEYLKQWGESFWLESEHRVQEITQTLEKSLSASVDAKMAPIPGLGEIAFNIGGIGKLTEEQKGEIVRRGQEIVNKVQMKTLSKIMELLETDLLDDKKQRYYITIDRLDENWIHDEFRYGLIKALIDTVRDFNHNIRNVKIIVAIREDLLDRVFRYTRNVGSGYQEEKYRSMYMNLSWKLSELEDLLDRRVNQLIREQYTTQTVALKDLFTEKISKLDPLAYFFDRTMLRPRDAILFFNECIKAAEGQTKITQAAVFQAEAIYSENRLRALADEWGADYPNLFELALFLKKYHSQFRLSQFIENIEECALKFLTSEKNQDQIYHMITAKFDANDMPEMGQEVIRILFRVGLVGVKTETYTGMQWSYLGQKLIASELKDDTVIKVHPAFWRVLGIQPI